MVNTLCLVILISFYFLIKMYRSSLAHLYFCSLLTDLAINLLVFLFRVNKTTRTHQAPRTGKARRPCRVCTTSRATKAGKVSKASKANGHLGHKSTEGWKVVTQEDTHHVRAPKTRKTCKAQMICRARGHAGGCNASSAH